MASFQVRVSMSNQVFSWSPVNLRSEVTETPGWLTGASKEVFRVRTQEFHPEPTPRDNRDSSLALHLCTGKRFGGDAPGYASAANDKRGALWGLRSLGHAGSARVKQRYRPVNKVSY